MQSLGVSFSACGLLQLGKLTKPPLPLTLLLCPNLLLCLIMSSSASFTPSGVFVLTVHPGAAVQGGKGSRHVGHKHH